MLRMSTNARVWRLACSAILVVVVATSAAAAVTWPGGAQLAHGPLSAGTVIARPGTATRLGAYGNAVAWSRLTTRLGVGRPRYVLLVRLNGRTQRVGIPAQGDDFEVALGPGPGGRPNAVYRRCRRGRCRVYRLDLATGREASVPRTDGARLPALWRNRIAFVRDDGGGERVVVQDLTGRSQHRFERPTPIPESETGQPAIVTGLALRGSRVAYTATTGPSSELCPDDGANVSASFDQLWTGRVGGLARRLQAGCSREYASPQYVGDTLSYIERDQGPTLRYLARRLRSDGRKLKARLPQTHIDALVTAGGWSYWMESLYTGRARLLRGRLNFFPVGNRQ